MFVIETPLANMSTMTRKQKIKRRKFHMDKKSLLSNDHKRDCVSEPTGFSL